MRRPRDRQKDDVHGAERFLECYGRVDRLQEIQAFVNAMICTTWFKSNWEDCQSIAVKDSKSMSAVSIPIDSDGNGIIKIHRRLRWKYVVLHKVAHCLSPCDKARHGQEFCCIFLMLIGRFLDSDAADDLESSFQKVGVSF